MNRRSSLFLVAVFSFSIAAGAWADVKVVSGSPRAQKVAAAAAQRTAGPDTVMQREKWTATRAILFDRATNSVRKPNAVETMQLVRSLQRLTTRPTRALKGSIQANGIQQGSINGDHANVIVARALPDGTMETRCVQTFDEAAEFLGLVRETPAGGTR